MAKIQNMPEYSFHFSDVVGNSLNTSVTDTKDKLDLQPREIREFVVGLVNLLNSIDGANSLSAKGFDNLQTTIQAMLNDLNSRKVDTNGDFKGTLNGMPIVAADPGLSSTVAYHTTQLNDITIDYNKLTNAKNNKRVTLKFLAYGDSNTRYYLGDSGKAGSITYAFSTVIDFLARTNPHTFNLASINKGFPGQTSAWAVANFDAQVKANTPDIVALGFGTNDIRNGLSFDDYIANMETLINNCIANKIVPIVVGIPWFSTPIEAQANLPTWNSALFKLCSKYNVPFVDVYNMFKDNPIFFNEATDKRHYSFRAQRILGQVIFDLILKALNLNPSEKPYIEDFSNFPNNASVIDKCTGADSLISYQSINNFLGANVLKVPAGATLTVNVRGSFCLSFLPLENCSINIVHPNSASGGDNINLVYSEDDGTMYPIQRYGVSSMSLIDYTATITVNSGNLYILDVASENMPKIAYTPTFAIDKSLVAEKRFVGRKYLINTVGNAYYAGNINPYGSMWRCEGAYYNVGNTAYQNVVVNNVPKGYRYYNTEDGHVYLHNGTTFTVYS